MADGYRLVMHGGLVKVFHGDEPIWVYGDIRLEAVPAEAQAFGEALYQLIEAVVGEHQWQDTGFADVDDCAVEGCRVTRSRPGD